MGQQLLVFNAGTAGGQWLAWTVDVPGDDPKPMLSNVHIDTEGLMAADLPLDCTVGDSVMQCVRMTCLIEIVICQGIAILMGETSFWYGAC